MTNKLCSKCKVVERDLAKYCYCKSCRRIINSKRNRREDNLLYNYGITIEEYKQLCIDCDNKCQICGNNCDRYSYLSVDHCHITNKVRGLLCHLCNISLGGFKDSISNLENAIKYLKVHEKP